MSDFYEKMIALAEAETSMPAKRYMRDNEHQIQSCCVTWFRYQWPQFARLLFAVPNGGARSKAQAGKLKAEGVVAGVSDLLLLVARKGYHGLCIEMKDAKGRQRDTQKDWQKAVEEQGYKYVLCRSYDDFVKEVNDYLGGK